MDWPEAATVQPAMLQSIAPPRPHSVLTDETIACCDGLETGLSVSPLLAKVGMRLDPLRIPLKVQNYHPQADQRAVRDRENPPQSGIRRSDVTDRSSASPGWDGDDRHSELSRDRRLYSRLGRREGKHPLLLDALEPGLFHAVFLGDPGSGKSEVLRLLPRRQAAAARAALAEMRALPLDVGLPVLVHLRALGDALKNEAGQRELLAELNLPLHVSTLNEVKRVALAALMALHDRHEFARLPRLKRLLRGTARLPAAAPALLVPRWLG